MLGRRRGRNGQNRRIVGWLMCGLGALGLFATVPIRAWLAVLAGTLVMIGWTLLNQS